MPRLAYAKLYLDPYFLISRMLTRCPQCLALHALEADRSAGNHGQFTCPDCGARFDAYAHLRDSAQADAELDAGAPPEEQGELFGPAPKPRPLQLPSFARQRIRLPRPAQLHWWLVSAGLLVFLLALIPIADRARLATDPEWRPRLASICAVLHCSLPPWHELSAFEVTTRDVQPHPSVAKALLITASFRNDAHFAQAWPVLELRMSDLNGRDVGLRRFLPQEYLGGAPPSALIAPGQTADASLEVVDPGRDAVAFAFDFH